MHNIIIGIILAIHTILCLLYFLLIKKHIAHLPEATVTVMFFVPFFGPLSILLLEWMILRKKEGVCSTDIYKLSLGDSIYNKITIEDDERPQEIVPLEEAILIDDVNTRRAIMMEILHQNPTQFLDLLMVARFNNDVELSHYAATSIMEIQREYELATQKTAVAVEQNPKDVAAMDKYINILGEYIDSGLLHDHLLYQQRIYYSKALAKIAELRPNRKNTYFKMIDNDIGMQSFTHARETAEFMQEKWPSDENVWLAGLKVYIESGDNAGKNKFISEIKRAPIEWTTAGKARMAFWYAEDPDKRDHNQSGNKLVGAI